MHIEYGSALAPTNENVMEAPSPQTNLGNVVVSLVIRTEGVQYSIGLFCSVQPRTQPERMGCLQMDLPTVLDYLFAEEKE